MTLWHPAHTHNGICTFMESKKGGGGVKLHIIKRSHVYTGRSCEPAQHFKRGVWRPAVLAKEAGLSYGFLTWHEALFAIRTLECSPSHIPSPSSLWVKLGVWVQGQTIYPAALEHCDVLRALLDVQAAGGSLSVNLSLMVLRPAEWNQFLCLFVFSSHCNRFRVINIWFCSRMPPRTNVSYCNIWK